MYNHGHVIPQLPPPPTRVTHVDAGTGARAVPLAVWGNVSTARDLLDMRIGLPAAALARAGISGLPDDYVLPIALRGPLTAPAIEWAAAARRLAVLSAMQLGRSSGSGGGGGGVGGIAGLILPAIFGGDRAGLGTVAGVVLDAVDARLQAELLEVPPREAKLPWHINEPSNPNR
jgi:hypothetical protein